MKKTMKEDAMFCALFLANLCGVPHEMWKPVLFYTEKGGVFQNLLLHLLDSIV